MTHPCRFSPEILEVFAEILLHEYPEWIGRPYLHDPCAGTGERLEALARRLDFYYSGTEIEPEFIVAPNIIAGDACDPSTYPDRRGLGNHEYVIVTSPSYPNGMSDSWVMSDESKRYNYRKALAEITGYDRPLHPNNQGGMGYRGTKRSGSSKKRREYWRIAREMVACWQHPGCRLVLLNVSDFLFGNGQVEPVVADWQAVLREFGFTDQIVHPVATQRMKNGENASERVANEVVIVARR